MRRNSNILRNTYVQSALLSLAVTLIMNLCFMLFMAYGDYISGESRGLQAGHEVATAHPDGQMANPKGERIIIGEEEERMHHDEGRMHRERHGIVPPDFWMHMGVNWVATFLLFLVSLKLLEAKRPKQQWHKNILVLLIMVVWVFVYAYVFVQVRTDDMPGARIQHMMRGIITVSAFNGLMVYFLSLLVIYITRWHDTAVENEALRTLNYSAQYEALKSKLDPHFLFNALNTLSGLIAIGSNQTEEYIQKLSTIFRTTLNHEDVVSIEQEMEFAKAYGDLMMIRYDNTLTILYEVPDEMMNSRIVSFSIQTLLENAIKHNTITAKMPMQITVGARDGYVVVCNPVHHKRETEKGNGLGLKLLSERCMAEFGQDIIIENNEESFVVSVPVGQKQ